jgi:hypothetical protein
VDSVCTNCLGYLAIRQATATLLIREPGDTATRLHAADYSLDNLAKALRKAFECGWEVRLDTAPIGPAITTWGGDPVCELHLIEQMSEYERKLTLSPGANAGAAMPLVFRTGF